MKGLDIVVIEDATGVHWCRSMREAASIYGVAYSTLAYHMVRKKLNSWTWKKPVPEDSIKFTRASRAGKPLPF